MIGYFKNRCNFRDDFLIGNYMTRDQQIVSRNRLCRENTFLPLMRL